MEERDEQIRAAADDFRQKFESLHAEMQKFNEEHDCDLRWCSNCHEISYGMCWGCCDSPRDYDD